MRIVWKDSNPKTKDRNKVLRYREFTITQYGDGWITNMPGDNNIYLPRESAYNAIDEILGEKAHTPHPKRHAFGVTIIGRRDDVS